MRRFAALAALPLLILGACGSAESGSASEASGDGACAYPATGGDAGVDAPPEGASQSGTVTSTVTIDAGGQSSDVTFDLDADAAPCTVNSFVSLAEQGYFDGTVCHRLTTQGIFVLQCGDPTATGTGNPGYSVPDEFRDDMTYGPGTLAMANSGQPNSGGSQFFIVYDGGEGQLPPEYTVFGTIGEGLDVIQGIAAEGTQDGGPDGAPKNEVTLESVTL